MNCQFFADTLMSKREVLTLYFGIILSEHGEVSVPDTPAQSCALVDLASVHVEMTPCTHRCMCICEEMEYVCVCASMWAHFLVYIWIHGVCVHACMCDFFVRVYVSVCLHVFECARLHVCLDKVCLCYLDCTQLCALPQLVQGYVPPMHRLPLFLLRLVTEVGLFSGP